MATILSEIPDIPKSSYTLFPIKHDNLWNMYRKQIDLFWRPEEIDLSKDLQDWQKLTKDEKYFISMILAFFAGSDGIVMENLAQRFMSDTPYQEAKHFYSFQIAMEAIHSTTYSILIETYIKDSTEKSKLFDGINQFPCIRKKAEWAQKWINDHRSSFQTRLVAFACVEGIFFSGAFSSIYWLKKRGLMPGLTFANELISRDEGLHTEFAIALYHKENKPANKQKVKEIIQEAVNIEIEFINESLPCKLLGMNADNMATYIKFVANRLALQLHIPKIFENINNPFDFMELISLEGKTNFFEKRVGEYSLAPSKTPLTFSLDF